MRKDWIKKFRVILVLDILFLWYVVAVLVGKTIVNIFLNRMWMPIDFALIFALVMTICYAIIVTVLLWPSISKENGCGIK